MASPYVGEIRLFAGLFAPENWALCQGQLLQINTYQALYSLVGTTYGGDGRTTFGIPDLRGRLVIGTGTVTPTTSAYALGQTGGATSVTLTEAQLPAHTHGLLASTAAATATSPAGAVLADPSDQYNSFINYVSTGTMRVMADADLLADGGNQAHTNMMPSQPLNYMICLIGLYPSQN